MNASYIKNYQSLDLASINKGPEGQQSNSASLQEEDYVPCSSQMDDGESDDDKELENPSQAKFA